MRNWGRRELIGDSLEITALALRCPSAAVLAEPALRGLAWSGQWIVLAQGKSSIFSGITAFIPLTAGSIEISRIKCPSTVKVVFLDTEGPLVDWNWVNGRVSLCVDGALAERPILGVLVSD